jgi:hypothetical protein
MDVLLSRMKRVAFLLPLFLLLPSPAPGQNAVTVFHGMPSVKISEGGHERVAENLSHEKGCQPGTRHQQNR